MYSDLSISFSENDPVTRLEVAGATSVRRLRAWSWLHVVTFVNIAICIMAANLNSPRFQVRRWYSMII